MLAAVESLPADNLSDDVELDPAVRARLPEFPPSQMGWLLAPARQPEAGTGGPVRVVRRRVASLVFRLASGVEERLPLALKQAEEAWHEAGQQRLLDEGLLTDLYESRVVLAALAKRRPGEPVTPVVSIATEGLWALKVSFALVALLESRLATILRMRKKMNDEALVVDERPFLDVAPALATLARRWA